jgi:hypothetical protein
VVETRRILICDDAAGLLGQAAVQLLRAGFDVLYAKESEEAELLARERSGEIACLLLAPGFDLAAFDRISKRVGVARGSAPGSVVAGARPDPARRAALQAQGVEAAVWKPDDDAAMRFAVNSALALPVEFSRRKALRVPTSLLAQCRCGGAVIDAVLYSLSRGGAFFETRRPFPVGACFELETSLDDGTLRATAEVAYQNPPEQGRDGRWPVGMGARFVALAPEQEALLAAYIDARAADFTL